jgi:N-acetylmuramoyl-L-alanine amidase
MQHDLNALGYKAGPEDKIAGPKTGGGIHAFLNSSLGQSIDPSRLCSTAENALAQYAIFEKARASAKLDKTPTHPEAPTIVLRSGHGETNLGGQKVVGASNKDWGTTEHEINTEQVKVTSEKLKQAGYNVVVVEPDNRHYNVNSRSSLEQFKHPTAVKGDVYLSIHNDVGGGNRVLIHTKNNPKNEMNATEHLAQSLQQQLNPALSLNPAYTRIRELNPSLHTGKSKTNPDSTRAAVLIEGYNLSDPNQLALAKTPQGSGLLADKIVRAIQEQYPLPASVIKGKIQTPEPDTTAVADATYVAPSHTIKTPPKPSKANSPQVK